MLIAISTGFGIQNEIKSKFSNLFGDASISKYGSEFFNTSENIDDLKMVRSIALITGFLSVPLGIGGAAIMVPIMKFYNYPIKTAIGTCAHFGIIISLTGFISMFISGYYFAEINEPYTLGYINFLGFMIFIPVTLPMARVGASFSSKIKKEKLNKIYGVVLIIISVRAFYEIFISV